MCDYLLSHFCGFNGIVGTKAVFVEDAHKNQ